MVDPIVSGSLCMSTLCAHEVGFAVRKKLWLHAGSIMNIIAFNHIIVIIINIFIKIIEGVH